MKRRSTEAKYRDLLLLLTRYWYWPDILTVPVTDWLTSQWRKKGPFKWRPNLWPAKWYRLFVTDWCSDWPVLLILLLLFIGHYSIVPASITSIVKYILWLFRPVAGSDDIDVIDDIYLFDVILTGITDPNILERIRYWPFDIIPIIETHWPADIVLLFVLWWWWYSDDGWWR